MAYEVELPNGHLISDDKARLDLDLVHRFLSTDSYWAAGRTRAMVARTIAGSLCLGAYGPHGQVGFARAITDRALFAWLADVFVLPSCRGKGLGRALAAGFLAHPELADVRRWMLATSDAAPLYESYGFVAVTAEDQLMKRLLEGPASVASEHSDRTS